MEVCLVNPMQHVSGGYFYVVLSGSRGDDLSPALLHLHNPIFRLLESLTSSIQYKRENHHEAPALFWPWLSPNWPGQSKYIMPVTPFYARRRFVDLFRPSNRIFPVQKSTNICFTGQTMPEPVREILKGGKRGRCRR